MHTLRTRSGIAYNHHLQNQNRRNWQQKDLNTVQTRAEIAYERQHGSQNRNDQRQDTQQELRAAIRHLTDNLGKIGCNPNKANVLPRLKQLDINLTPPPLDPMAPDSPKGPNFKLHGQRGRHGGLLPGLAFRLGCCANLTALHVTAPESELVSLLCKACEAATTNNPFPNLDSLIARYTPEHWEILKQQLHIKVRLEVAEVDGLVTDEMEKEVVESGQ